MIFDLTTESWLPVVNLDGTLGEVSLTTALTRAHTLRRIVGETPPMTAALHRLVLALVHRAYGPQERSRWRELWESDQLPGEPLRGYFAKYPDRFDLFDPERPFFQCPAVATATAYGAANLVQYRSAGNNRTLFDHTTAGDELLLTAAEAARWLVTLQAYDTGGTKTPYRTVKYSEQAPGNRIGIVLIEGGNFKETLLLNLMRYDPANERPPRNTAGDRPIWESEPPDPEPDQRPPYGWADQLTWPSRRIWLSHRQEGETIVVDRVVITPGTRPRVGEDTNEWMAAYRRPRRAKKRHGQADKADSRSWRPVRLETLRGVWRHSVDFLLAPVGSEEHQWRRPETLEHVAEMAGWGYLPHDAVYTIRVFGQQLDSKGGGVVEHVLEEAVCAPVALLRARADELGPVIGQSVRLADRTGDALRDMTRSYRRAFVPPAPTDRRRVEPLSNIDLAYWPRLARPFDDFLRTLSKEPDSEACRGTATREWEQHVRRIADRAARQWVEGAQRAGRNLDTAGECYGRFFDQMISHVGEYRGYIAGYVS